MSPKINELWQKVKSPAVTAWQGLSARDQRALTLLCVVLMPLLLIALFWWPSFDARQMAMQQYSQQTALLSTLQQEAPRLRQSATQAAKPSLAEMPSRLQQLAQAQSLTITKVEPDNTGVTLNMNSVILVSLVRFLDQCKQQGIQAEEVLISKDGESFQVKLRFPA